MAIDEKKPSKNEDEYFARRDAELMKERRQALDAERAQRARSQNLLKCPRCGGDLVEREHQHVKIDECSSCGGVWLDKGELEMINDFDRGNSGFLSSLFRSKR
ncbi:MAG TPA: zf-TFIIB domain-containing protein [Gemmatimonadaceae bacterium]|nr:zf-TFIIB domain-containing protein [Gemmatimonadaceae bacterium]